MKRLHLAAVGSAALIACAASAPRQPTAQSVATADTGAAPTSNASTPAAPPTSTSSSTSTPTPIPSPSSSPSSSAPESSSACNEQSPQDFLVRHNFLKEKHGNERAIQYRTDTYGYFAPFGHPGPDAHPPSYYAVTTTFMGLPVRMHRKVVPALKCVEEEIKQTCADHPYTAHALAGIRFRNTYRGGEVTNHIYGIAIDVDPSINTCCGCVKPWSDSPRCKKPAKTEYDRMVMPECWVHAFERYGFYWLGHDVLRDTMHFEFLGDPDKILKDPPSPAAAANASPPAGGGS